MERLTSSAKLMIVSDLDHTMVDHHDPENISLLRFNALWESSYRRDSLLVFSTGRSPTLYKQLRKEKPMLTPDITIMSVGTEITYGNLMVPDGGWEEVLNQKWDRKIVEEETSKFPELTLQSETEQRPHKVSFYVDKSKAQDVTKKLSELFDKSRVGCQNYLQWRNGFGHITTSIPDVYGVMVSNAQEELLLWHAEKAKDNPKVIHATERCASGIIQAIGHFGLGPNTSPRDEADLLGSKMENLSPGGEVVRFYLLHEKWRRGEIENSESYITTLEAVCQPPGIFVHPSGVEQSFRECISALKGNHGDQKGKQYRVWVDQVFPMKIGSDTWLVKFQKWEMHGEEQQSCLCSAVLVTKDADGLDGWTWLHLHQTWSSVAGAKDHLTWLL
ncbi:hypothetical protein NL676_016681 [Syzygium grande]|nr:hypothetical protein NL676_016681 [Syzygium grande]